MSSFRGSQKPPSLVCTGVESSGDSRRSLQAEIARRRGSLSHKEIEFLDQLCINGNEIEVQVARRRLLDEDLFPVLSDDGVDEKSSQLQERTISDSPFIGSIQYGGERSLSDIIDDSLSKAKELELVEPSKCNLGSERRQSLLDLRKKSTIFGSLWRSHQNGLSLSTGASRRNLMERRSSLSQLNRCDRGANAKNDNIFRSLSVKSMAKLKLTEESQSTRVQGRRLSFRRSQTTGTLQAGRRASASPLSMERPQAGFQRQRSDMSRKSVTFGELPMHKPEDGDVSGSFLSAKKPPLRSDSLSSIPSLHKAHRISSVGSSSMRSLSSIPSLHLAHHVHSQSFRSSNSLGSSWDLNDDSMNMDKMGEEKKTDDIPEDIGFETAKETQELRLEDKVSSANLSRPVLVSDATENEGQGVEVADFEIYALYDKKHSNHSHFPSIDSARRLDSLLGDGSESFVPSASFDETMSHGRISDIFRRSNITRTLSNDDLAGIFLGGTRLYLRESSSAKEMTPTEDEASWLDSEIDELELDYYDPWKVIEDEYVNGYGGGGTLPFLILGTSADDVDSQPHVLSPPLMESLQEFLPFGLMGENFWMKYSLVRDGASMVALLKAARGAKSSFLAIETVDGEVFGSFTTQPWRKNWNYFGGTESFLWRMQHSRKEKTKSIIDQAQMESEIEVYPYTGTNDHIQLCTHDKLAIGGRSDIPWQPGDGILPLPLKDIKEHEWGFVSIIGSLVLTFVIR